MRATSETQALAWATRLPPRPEEVIPGLWSIALPADDNPIAYTLDYVFELGDGGIAIVDTGWATPQSYDALVEALGAIGYSIADLRAVLITHMHPDHFALTPRLLAENPAIGLYMHPADLMLVDDRSDAIRERNHDDWLELMRSIGSPAELGMTVRATPAHRVGSDVSDRVIEVTHDEVIELGPWRLRAVWTPGHTPGHLCYLVEGSQRLLTGDHILPTISPQVAQLTYPREDVLGRYLESLRALRALDVVEVLPAHQYRFAGLLERIDELLAHHDHRFQILETEVAREPGQTCFSLAAALDWKYPLIEMSSLQARLAVKETLAHLMHLRTHGRLVTQPGPPSTWWPASA